MTTTQERQVTPHRTLAALAAVVHRRTGHQRVGIELHREDESATTLVIDLADNPTLRCLIDRTAETLHASADGTDGQADLSARLAADGTLTTFTILADEADAHGHALIAQDVAALLAAADAQLDVALSRLELTTAAGRGIVHGKAAACETPLHQLVLAHAASSPHAVAVNGDQPLTYAELDARSGALARELRALGTEAGGVVGVLIRRSPELIVALLAVLRAGAAYLALDPDDPSERRARLLADARARVLVTDPSLAGCAPDGVRPHCPGDAVGAPAPDPARDTTQPEDLAYVAYTSGSTGEPKGVAVTHRAVARLVSDPSWMTIRTEDVFLQLAPVSFDASTLEIWAPLANGAQLALFPAGSVDLAEIARALRERAVSVLWLTAGLFHQMVASHLDAFAGLRHVISGGDVIAPDRVRTLLAAHPHLTFTNGYGPTENTTFTTCWTSSVAPPEGASVPIGTPINGTGVVVLDEALRPVPAGVVGELYATGAGLAAGYLHRPGATAERFLPCPLPQAPRERMYRTGDLARWLPSGDLEFLGRADQQVKIQGYRIEPGAVEAELADSPLVDQAVVVAQPDGAGGKRLLAYVTLADGGLDPAAGVRLREQLARTLPSHQVPWAILVRDRFPLTRNGKVDRHALPSAARVPRNVWNDFVQPRSPLESTLVELWGSLLGIEPVGVEDDFFDLGGHSLLAVDLIETLRRRFDVELQARTLYLQPTVAELAGNLAALLPSSAASEEGTP
ncbi:non-ribosomal peptide synthetase [Actinospica durhamensis]|uniref:Non-ribosomal peptide synthetase n=1 Tax=Actinospica durhamensis TaxID=1508375 RepID=A0A941EPQ6_9ACTN|nr:non-ribosomal peptide synthetase [Actinospica durhamensis]MBR7834891.1 non-ribosomal peptide synthetase [Actinospica durhamensis]